MSALRRSSRNSSAEPVELNLGVSRQRTPRPKPKRPAAAGQKPTPVGQIPLLAKESTSYGSTSDLAPSAMSGMTAAQNLQYALGRVEYLEAREEPEGHPEPEAETENGTDQEDLMETPMPAATRGRGGARGTSRAFNGGRGRGGRVASATPGTSPGPDGTQSFTEESGLAGEASIGDDTPEQSTMANNSRHGVRSGARTGSRTGTRQGAATPSALQSIVEEPQQSAAPFPDDVNQLWEQIHGIARERREVRVAATPWYLVPLLWLTYFLDWIKLVCETFGLGAIWRIPQAAMQGLFNSPGKVLLCALIYFAILFTGTPLFRNSAVGQLVHNYDGITNNLSQFLPRIFTHPHHILKSEEFRELDKRLSNLETYYLRLSRDVNLDAQAIARLEKVLPSSILLSKDEKGNPVISQDFWLALEAKMNEEGFTGRQEIGSTTSDAGIPKAFSEWARKNEEKVKIWASRAAETSLDAHISDALNKQALLSKDDVIIMISEAFTKANNEVRTEQQKIMSDHNADINSRLAAIPTSSPDHAVGFTENEVKSIATEALNRIIPTSQLAALAKVKLHENVANAMQRTNFFSIGLGAVVNPLLSSTTLEFFKQRYMWPKRALLTMLGHPGPTANTHIAALTKWDEPGDCWCATVAEDGSTQLAVMLQTPIYPDEIVVEHVHPTATLDSGSAPTKMEVLVLMEDWDVISEMHSMAKRLFYDREPEKVLNEKWVPIAQFYYDHETAGAQAFKVDIDLHGFKAPTSQVIVRALKNAGSPHTCMYRLRLHGDKA